MHFLTCFNSIFTLNQDLLLEMHYYHNNAFVLSSNGRWIAGGAPGVYRDNTRLVNVVDYCDQKWVPQANLPTSIAHKNQPYFKLHGSSNWYSSSEKQLLIAGGNKEKLIKTHPLLNWYQEKFKEYVSAPNTKLMIIGYSFSDEHINAVLHEAVCNTGLKLFIIDPQGLGAINYKCKESNSIKNMCVPSKENDLLHATIGASRRTLKEIFGGDEIEYQKVMRFFN